MAPDVPEGWACGRRNRSGGPCELRAGFGTNHVGEGACKYHGGKAGQVEAAAARRARQAELETAVVTYGLPVDVDPAEALLEEVRRTVGHVRWVEAQIRELDPQDLIWGQLKEQHQKGRTAEGRVNLRTHEHGAAINVWLVIYQAERKHLEKVASSAVKAGVMEQRIRLAQQAGERVGEFLQLVLAGLPLTPTQLELVIDRSVRHLELLQGGAA